MGKVLLNIINVFSLGLKFFRFQHSIVCIFQAVGLLVVSMSQNIYASIVGVVIVSVGGGIGEMCYIALTSHYSKF